MHSSSNVRHPPPTALNFTCRCVENAKKNRNSNHKNEETLVSVAGSLEGRDERMSSNHSTQSILWSASAGAAHARLCLGVEKGWIRGLAESMTLSVRGNVSVQDASAAPTHVIDHDEEEGDDDRHNQNPCPCIASHVDFGVALWMRVVRRFPNVIRGESSRLWRCELEVRGSYQHRSKSRSVTSSTSTSMQRTVGECNAVDILL